MMNNPDTLRETLNRVFVGDYDDDECEGRDIDALYACADAREADALQWTGERTALRQRLEAARLAWNECNFVELDVALAAREDK